MYHIHNNIVKFNSILKYTGTGFHTYCQQVNIGI